MKIEALEQKLQTSGFNGRQIDVIKKGIEQMIEVSVYAKLEYDADQMNEILLGLLHAVNVEIYADSNYSALQMRVLRQALENHLDVAAIKGSYLQMLYIYEGLLLNFDTSCYAHFDEQRMYVIYNGLVRGLDVSVYAVEQADAEQMYEIMQTLSAHIDCDTITARDKSGNFIYSASQMRELRLGIMHNVDIKLFADPEYNFAQMKMIRLGEEEHLNVKDHYATAVYNSKQMNAIRLGLHFMINTLAYEDPKLSAECMNAIRLGIMSGYAAKDFYVFGMTADEIRASIRKLEAIDTSITDSEYGMEITENLLDRICTAAETVPAPVTAVEEPAPAVEEPAAPVPMEEVPDNAFDSFINPEPATASTEMPIDDEALAHVAETPEDEQYVKTTLEREEDPVVPEVMTAGERMRLQMLADKEAKAKAEAEAAAAEAAEAGEYVEVPDEVAVEEIIGLEQENASQVVKGAVVQNIEVFDGLEEDEEDLRMAREMGLDAGSPEVSDPALFSITPSQEDDPNAQAVPGAMLANSSLA